VVNVAAGMAGTDAVNLVQLTNEASARTSADVALGQRIDTVSGRLSQLESSAGVFSAALTDTNFRIEDLDQRMSGGVAAAAALGSAILMPGKRFTITGNVANYNGEQGFAVGFTGRVSEDFALGAGIAGNTGDGEIITQAGFAFGWEVVMPVALSTRRQESDWQAFQPWQTARSACGPSSGEVIGG